MIDLKIKYKRDRSKHISRSGPIYKYVHRELIRLWKDAIRVFIQVAINRVHVDTGMSRAQFYPLTSELRLVSMLQSEFRGYGPKKPYTELLPGGIRGTVHKDVFKSKSLGKSLGTSPKAYIIKYGDTSRPVFEFRFSIVVWQYYLNEHGIGHGRKVEAWQSLDHGAQAFKYFIHENAKRYISDKRLVQMLLEGV